MQELPICLKKAAATALKLPEYKPPALFFLVSELRNLYYWRSIGLPRNGLLGGN